MVSMNKIDIHNTKTRYLKKIDTFMEDNTLTCRNRELIKKFLDDCALGKTVKKRQRKKIKERRLYKYLYHLKLVAKYMKIDFDKYNIKDMEKFIDDLENNRIELVNSEGRIIKKKYASETQRDIKIAVRKFYKWLWGNCVRDPDIVNWFDTSKQEKEVQSLDESEIVVMVEFAPTIMKKALIWTLYESGARSEEFLNIRLSHALYKESHYVVSIEFPKTFKRAPPVYETPLRARGNSYLEQWINQHPNKTDPTAQLFPVSYRTMAKLVKEIGLKALGKNVTPHILRDSGATYLANKQIGRYRLCKIMGWTMSSKMPDRYINRAGVIEEEAIESIRRDDLSKLEESNLKLKKDILELEQKNHQLERHSQMRSSNDNVMEKLFNDNEIQSIILKKIKELGLANQILSN